PSPADSDPWDAEGLYLSEDIRIAVCGYFKTSQRVSTESIGSELGKNYIRIICGNKWINYLIKGFHIDWIVSVRYQWQIYRIAEAFPDAKLVFEACTWKKINPALMHRYDKHLISFKESLLNPVSMMRINIQIDDSFTFFKERIDSNDGIIQIGES